MPDSYRNAIVIGLCALAAALAVAWAMERRGGSSALEIDLAAQTPGDMQVYITGAVAKPGVYQIEPGERVVDVLYKAGGPAPEANIEAVNLSLRLEDEAHVIIPRLNGGQTSAVAGVSTSGAININTASAEELDTLPGIGEVYSQRIVESRTTDGPFATVDDLAARQIIPQATFERIRELITAGP